MRCSIHSLDDGNDTNILPNWKQHPEKFILGYIDLDGPFIQLNTVISANGSNYKITCIKDCLDNESYMLTVEPL